jgi:cell division protein ZapE
VRRAARHPDYLALARRYHTVILAGIPALDANHKSEAARFKLLVDTLYEHSVKLLASADRDPDVLYCASDDAFEFERTVSRLTEMGSRDYLALGHGAGAEGIAAAGQDTIAQQRIPVSESVMP